MPEARKKSFQFRLNRAERDRLRRFAAQEGLTPSALLRSILKREYEAMLRADRQQARLEADDILVLQALSTRTLRRSPPS
jgi:hypothetical protein